MFDILYSYVFYHDTCNDMKSSIVLLLMLTKFHSFKDSYTSIVYGRICYMYQYKLFIKWKPVKLP